MTKLEWDQLREIATRWAADIPEFRESGFDAMYETGVDDARGECSEQLERWLDEHKPQ